MKHGEVVLYTSPQPLRCWRAKRLLTRRGYGAKAIDTSNGDLRDLLGQFVQNASQQTVSYLFVDHRPVGGFEEIKALDYSGDLERLVRGEI